MRPCALLFVCGLVCLGEELGVQPGPAPDAKSTEGRVLQVQMEVDAPSPWSLSVGDSVTVRCSLSPGSDLDPAETLSLHMERKTSHATERLTTQSEPRGISVSLNPVTLEHSGLYSCGGDTTTSQVTVDHAHIFIFVNDSSSTVSLELLRVNRVKYFYGKNITIGCKVPNDKSEWTIMSASEMTGLVSPCPNQERSGDVLSCSITSPPFEESTLHDSFWCESPARPKSNALDVTKAEQAAETGRAGISTKFEATPGWFVREGDSVVLQCSVRADRGNNSDKCDLQLIWTKRNPTNDMTVLASQRATTPILYTLNNITHEHSGVYSCWDDGTLANVFTHPWHHFIWVQDDSPPVTIDVLSHNRTQIFNNEVVIVGCQLPNDQSQWKIKRFNKWTGTVEECDKPQLPPSRLLTCTMKMGYPWGHLLFWCESSTGLRSNALNMTSTVAAKVLEAPPLPVMEGEDLTLRCLQRNKATGEITAIPAAFRLNARTFDVSDVGSITIRNVSKEREGFYDCRPRRTAVESHQSYVTVKARPEESTD